MIEVNIPQDIREFEPTLLGSFTTRQVLCGLAGAVMVYLGYKAEIAAGIASPMSFPLFLLPAIPCFFIGWYKPYGMHFEQFFLKAAFDNFFSPKHRALQEKNFYDQLSDKIKYEGLSQQEIAKLKKQENKRKNTKTNKISNLRLPPELRSYPERFKRNPKKVLKSS